MGLGFPFVYLVFVYGAAGSVVVLAVVFFLSVWVRSGLVGFGLDKLMLVVDASRVRHFQFHVAFALRVRSALVNGLATLRGVGHVVVLIVGSPMV